MPTGEWRTEEEKAATRGVYTLVIGPLVHPSVIAERKRQEAERAQEAEEQHGDEGEGGEWACPSRSGIRISRW